MASWNQTALHLSNLEVDLAPQFPTIVNELGFHNMSVERALRAANDLLSRQGWVTLTVWTATAVEPLTLSRQAWHPAQAATDPSAIRPQGDSQCAPTA